MIQSFLSQLILTKFILTPEPAGNATRIDVASPMIDDLLSRQSLLSHLILNRWKWWKWWKARYLDIQVLKSDKSYIYSNFNPGRVNVIDLIKDNFTLQLSVKEVLDELECSKDDYYRAISISKDEQLELYLKKETNSCFINNYFNVGFKSWWENMGIQPAFN